MSSIAKVHPNEVPPAYQGQTSGTQAPPPPPPAQATYQPPPPQQAQATVQPPPPPGYYGGAQQTTVVVAQPVGFGRQGYGPSPAAVQCPHCSANVTTSTSRSCGAMVWIVAGIICLIGFSFPLIWLGFCLIPFCIPSLYDVNHTCPNCMKQVGQYKAGGGM